jgi:hypothetical protein
MKALEPTSPISDALSANHLGPTLSALAVVVATLPLLWLVAVASSRLLANLRLGLAANRSFDPRAPLRPGRSVVCGSVELLPAEAIAVRVELRQHGREHHSRNGTTHTWTEETRRVEARPFLLRRAEGDAVRVEPTAEVQLVDKLDQELRHSHSERTLRGELSPGERVYAAGLLVPGAPLPGVERGYREAPPRELVLRAPPGGRLLLAAERLGARFFTRMRFHLRWLLLGLGGLAALELVLLQGYWRSWADGERVEAEVTRRHSYSTGGGKSRRTYHHLYLRRSDPYERSFRIDAAASSFKRIPVGARVILREVRRGPLLWRGIALGAEPTLHLVAVGFALALGIGLAAGFAVRRRSTRPWYDRELYTVSGKGPL